MFDISKHELSCNFNPMVDRIIAIVICHFRTTTERIQKTIIFQSLTAIEGFQIPLNMLNTT
jgi:hypothetical protein